MKILISIICIILPTLLYSNGSFLKAEGDNNIPILEAELFITHKISQIQFGEESTIGLRFYQSGFNWTDQLNKKNNFIRNFIYSKIFLPLRFPSARPYLGYNSVVFEAEIIDKPYGWEAWVNPSSVTNFTGGCTIDLNLHIKVSKPTSKNTATIRIRYTAYSGGSNIMGTATTDVLVSVKQYHLAEINSLDQHKEVNPDSIAYFPIEVKNRGNYEDTFEFEVNNKNESSDFLCLISGQITLKPGETGQVTAMILTPYVYLYDFGTQTSINISAYSIYEHEKKFSTSISITSKGFLLSDIFLLTIIILIFIIIFLYRIKKINLK